MCLFLFMTPLVSCKLVQTPSTTLYLSVCLAWLCNVLRWLGPRGLSYQLPGRTHFYYRWPVEAGVCLLLYFIIHCLELQELNVVVNWICKAKFGEAASMLSLLSWNQIFFCITARSSQYFPMCYLNDLNTYFIYFYSFTGADAVKYIVSHAEVAAVFCTPDKLQTVSSFYLRLIFEF